MKIESFFKKQKNYKRALFVLSQLEKHHFESYFVGGSVRDAFLKRKIDDFDIATKAKPNQIKKIFKKTSSLGQRFGSIGVIFPETCIQVTTFRKDSSYKDQRHPESISFSSLEEDALRRDFKINAFYFNPIRNEFFDFFNGKKDLKDKKISCIGDSHEKIKEDHLRILRAIRFSACLNFNLDSSLLKAIQKNKKNLKNLNPGRLKVEWSKILDATYPKKAFLMIQKSSLIKTLFSFKPQFFSSLSKIPFKKLRKQDLMSFVFCLNPNFYELIKKDQCLLITKKEKKQIQKNLSYLKAFLKAQTKGEKIYTIYQSEFLKNNLKLYLSLKKQKNFLFPKRIKAYFSYSDLKKYFKDPLQIKKNLKKVLIKQFNGDFSSKKKALTYLKSL